MLIRVALVLLASLASQLLAQEGPPPGVVIATSPDSDKAYIGTQAIAILPDGSYVAAHDFFGKNPDLTDRTRVYGSRDRGAIWTRLSEIRGQAWFSLFVHTMDGSVCTTDVATGRAERLTVSRIAIDSPEPLACVFSPDGRHIAFTRRVTVVGGTFSQIFIVTTPSP